MLKKADTEGKRKNTYGLFSKDKIDKQELVEFKKKVCYYLSINGIDLSKIKMRCQSNYAGNIKVLTYKTDLMNNKKSIRKADDGNYYRSKYSKTYQMGIYFYKTEWDWYNLPEQKDQREWDIADIKKQIEVNKIRLAI